MTTQAVSISDFAQPTSNLIRLIIKHFGDEV